MGRLASMGLLPGSLVTVLASPPGGAVMISVKGDTLCLGRGMADKVLVQ
jgi:Fe2+ transport system protein FeoA